MCLWAVIINFFGFGLLLLSDWIQVRGRAVFSRIPGTSGYLLVLFGSAFYILSGIIARPLLTLRGGIFLLLLVLCAWLLVKSLVLDIRPFSGGEQAGVSATRTAVTRGTYAICRHPGFLWYALLLFFSSLFVWKLPFTLGALVLVGGNFILVLLEDLIFFPKIFDNYETYKREVPFVFPWVSTGRISG